jgi:hypothetical protein
MLLSVPQIALGLMSKPYNVLIFYVIVTGVLPVLLAYPSLIYLDLAGMGGYDGFASVAMMEKHGVWSSTEDQTMFYYAFGGLYILWCISLVNLPIALVVILRKFQKKRQGT